MPPVVPKDSLDRTPSGRGLTVDRTDDEPVGCRPLGVGRQSVTRRLLELKESLGIPVVDRLGMGTVPEGHWCRMVVTSHPLWSFVERSAENCVENCRTRRETDTSSIGISLRKR